MARELDDALHVDSVRKVVRPQPAEVRRHRDGVVRIVLGRDEVQRLAHQRRAHDGPVVQSAAQILPLRSPRAAPRARRRARAAAGPGARRADAPPSGRRAGRARAGAGARASRGSGHGASAASRRGRYNVRMRRLAIVLVLLVPAVGERERRRSARREGALSACGAGRIREHARRRAGPLRGRARPRRGGRSPPGRVSPASARSAPTCSRGAGHRSRGPRRSTAPTASAAPLRSRRCRGPAAATASGGPTRRWPAGSPPSPPGERRRRHLGPRPRLRPLRRLPAGDALRGCVDGQARRARRRRCAPRRRPERSRWWYDVRQIGFWSSNLAANRIAGEPRLRRGRRRAAPARDDVEHVPGAVPRDDAWRPPGAHTRVTTARDLGRALYRLHAGAHGERGCSHCSACPAARRSSRCGCSPRRSPSATTPGCSGRGSAARPSRRRTAGSPTRARPRRSSTAAGARRSSSSSSTARASRTPRRSSWDGACWHAAGLL